LILKEFIKIDGIKVFDESINLNHEDYNAKGLDNLYRQEEKHFWFLSRKSFILQNFNNYIDRKEKIIEIGAGTGNVSRYLFDNGFDNISIGEMHMKGLRYAKTYGIKECYQFDLLNTPFANEFDVVCMFDVLEHIKDDSLALENVYKMLNKNGKIVLTVPSHMWLWNREDAIAGHKIRYTRNDLIKKLQKSGFEIVTARYFFISIVPLLLLRRLLNKDNGSKVKKEEYDNDISMNGLLSRVLQIVSDIENRLNKYLPNLFGGSLFIIGRKSDTF
jgi:2-polyprenyl-3-methyl-5-hydroxy-6-metoxy-1,4-benzoquinol methylase